MARHALRIARYLTVLTSLMALVSCSQSPTSDEYQYLRVTINGHQTLGISPKEGMIRGVIVYFHDAGVDEFTLTAPGSQQDITASLVQAGFAIISAGIGKDGFGDPDLVNAYLKLGTVASDHYRTDRLYLLSAGMGAIPAIGALAELSNTQRVRGLIAINPVLDLESTPPEYESYVAKNLPLSDSKVNPTKLPSAALEGRRIAFFVDSNNSASKSQVASFVERFGASSDIKVTECDNDNSCYPGSEIVTIFSQFERGKA